MVHFQSDLSPAIVLACEGGDEPALNATRALGERGVPVIVISEHADCAAACSRYCVEHLRVASFSQDPLGLLNILRHLSARSAAPMAVLPTADPDLEALSLIQGELDGTAISVLCDAGLVAQLIDKDAFRALAQQHGLPVPATFLPADFAHLQALATRLPYPLVAKPAFPFNWSPALSAAFRGRKAILVQDAEELVALGARLDATHPGILLQEYVQGTDDAHYDVHAYIDRQGRAQAVFTGRKWRLHPPHAGSGCHVESVHEPELEAATVAMLQSLGYTGIANVNWKRDATTGRDYLLEINARLSQWSIFTTRCGVNLAWLAWCDAVGYDAGKPVTALAGRWFIDGWSDLRSMRQYRREGAWRWWPYLRSILRPGTVFQVFNLRDLAPWRMLTMRHVRQVASSRLGTWQPDSSRSTASWESRQLKP